MSLVLKKNFSRQKQLNLSEISADLARVYNSARPLLDCTKLAHGWGKAPDQSYLDSIAILAFLAGAVLVSIIIKLTLERQRDYQADEKTEMQDEDKGKEIKVPSSDVGQPSRQTEISEIHNPPNLPAECLHNLQEQLTEEDIEMSLRLALQSLNLQTVAAEGPAEQNMKNGVKVACLVISVSATGIVSFLAGVPGSRSSMTSKVICKSGIISMLASFFSALVLLMLSTKNAKVSCSNQSLRKIIWVSTGLMTLAVVLLLTFYLVIT